jgi:hypothetical protein
VIGAQVPGEAAVQVLEGLGLQRLGEPDVGLDVARRPARDHHPAALEERPQARFIRAVVQVGPEVPPGEGWFGLLPAPALRAQERVQVHVGVGGDAEQAAQEGLGLLRPCP